MKRILLAVLVIALLPLMYLAGRRQALPEVRVPSIPTTPELASITPKAGQSAAVAATPVRPPPGKLGFDLSAITPRDPAYAHKYDVGTEIDPGYESIQQNLTNFNLSEDQMRQVWWVVWEAGAYSLERARKNKMEVDGEPFDETNPKQLAGLRELAEMYQTQGALRVGFLLGSGDRAFWKSIVETPLKFAPPAKPKIFF